MGSGQSHAPWLWHSPCQERFAGECPGTGSFWVWGKTWKSKTSPPRSELGGDADAKGAGRSHCGKLLRETGPAVRTFFPPQGLDCPPAYSRVARGPRTHQITWGRPLLQAHFPLSPLGLCSSSKNFKSKQEPEGSYALRPDLEVSGPHASQEEFLVCSSLSPCKHLSSPRWDVFLPACLSLVRGPDTRLLMYDKPQ